MAIPPQAAMNAPKGPRNPQMFTEALRNGDSRASVVERISHPQVIPARTPQKWMARCAGVQNVSRPIERCQEISQCTPIMADVTAATAHQMGQGTVAVRTG